MNYRRLLCPMRNVILAVVVLVFSAQMLPAGDMQGNFTLPFDVYWAGVLVPAGDYTFTLNSMGQAPISLRSSTGKTIVRLVAYTEEVKTDAKSQLVLLQSATQKPTVHILYLAGVHAAYHFEIPQRYEVTSKIIASSSGAADIVHVPVTISGN